VTRGCGARGANPAGAHSPTLLATVATLPPELEQRALRGYRLITSQWRKPAADALPTQMKTGNYLNSILAMQQAVQCQADEAVLLNDAAEVVECSQSCLFLVNDGCVLTPTLDSGGLHSITRELLIELAQRDGVTVRQTSICMASCEQAQEAFISNSVIGVAPVAQIDAIRFAVPGQVTAWLQAQWLRLLRP
jgi:branched-chain amino acid aminotransferase